MNSVELIKLIKDNKLQETFCEFGISYNTLIEFFEAYGDDEDIENFKKLKLDNVESVDSSYNSDTLYNVVYFKDYNIYLKFTGEYDSYGQGEHYYKGNITEVFPKRVEQTIYE